MAMKLTYVDATIRLTNMWPRSLKCCAIRISSCGLRFDVLSGGRVGGAGAADLPHGA